MRHNLLNKTYKHLLSLICGFYIGLRGIHRSTSTVTFGN